MKHRVFTLFLTQRMMADIFDPPTVNLEGEGVHVGYPTNPLQFLSMRDPPRPSLSMRDPPRPSPASDSSVPLRSPTPVSLIPLRSPTPVLTELYDTDEVITLSWDTEMMAIFGQKGDEDVFQMSADPAVNLSWAELRERAANAMMVDPCNLRLFSAGRRWPYSGSHQICAEYCDHYFLLLSSTSHIEHENESKLYSGNYSQHPEEAEEATDHPEEAEEATDHPEEAKDHAVIVLEACCSEDSPCYIVVLCWVLCSSMLFCPLLPFLPFGWAVGQCFRGVAGALGLHKSKKGDCINKLSRVFPVAVLPTCICCLGFPFVVTLVIYLTGDHESIVPFWVFWSVVIFVCLCAWPVLLGYNWHTIQVLDNSVYENSEGPCPSINGAVVPSIWVFCCASLLVCVSLAIFFATS